MNTSGDRLRTLLRECHLSATDFAANRQVTPQHVNNWFKRGIPMARLDEVAELLSVTSRWLRTGEGPKHPSDPANESDGGEQPLAVAHGANADVELPLYAAAQGGKNTLRELQGHKIRLPTQMLKSLNINPRDAMCLHMNGNSMAERLQDGSLLGIDRNTTQVIDGEIYALEHGGLLRIRYLYRMPNGGLRLRSHNAQEYPEETFSADQISQQAIRVLGWVFWWSTLNQRKNPLAGS